uniref:Uncharacterized protein n=1 Tax=viral metagenome TaxID=1070528 RepID=A0A6C0BCP8_9ZZZZ
MCDAIELVKFALQGVERFPNVPGKVKFEGNIFYHFFNIDETSHVENSNLFIRNFGIETQDKFEFNKGNINNKIVSGDYDLVETTEIVPFSRLKFTKGKNDSLTKFKINLEDLGRNFFCILTASIKCKKGSIRFNVIVHIYSKEEDRDSKYHLSDNNMKMQFSK